MPRERSRVTSLKTPVAEEGADRPPARLRSRVPPSILESQDGRFGEDGISELGSQARRGGVVLVLKRRGGGAQRPPALRVPRRSRRGSCPVLNADAARPAELSPEPAAASGTRTPLLLFC